MKKENLAAATALHVAHYNFCRIHGTLKCTPAMAAGIVPTLWGIENLFDAVMDRVERKKKAERLERLMRRLRSE